MVDNKPRIGIENRNSHAALFLSFLKQYNALLRYLVIECEEQENNGKQDGKVREMYMTVMKMFSDKLLKGNSELKKRRQYLQRQQNFIKKLVELVKVISII